MRGLWCWLALVPMVTCHLYGPLVAQVNMKGSSQFMGQARFWDGIPSGDDGRYCTAGETTSFPGGVTTDGPAALPTVCVYTALSAWTFAAPPSVPSVCPPGQNGSGGNCTYSTVGAMMLAATCGNTYTIQAAFGGAQNAYTENIDRSATSTQTCGASNPILIETDQIAVLNSAYGEGVEITPCATGKASIGPAPSAGGRPTYPCASPSFLVPKIIGQNVNQSTLAMNSGDSHWRFIGIEFTAKGGQTSIDSVVNMANQTGSAAADHIILDRILCHGADDPNWMSSVETQSCINAAGTYMAVINSYVADTKCAGTCVDSQAIAFGNGSAAKGPIKIVNNFLESSGETWLSGGGIGTVNPTDIEIRRNHSFKPLFWQACTPLAGGSGVCGAGSQNSPNYFLGATYTGHPVIKNLGEFKQGQRMLVEGNVFENNWGGQSDETGYAFLLGPKNQSSFQTGTATSDGAGNLTAIAGNFPNVLSPNCPIANSCFVAYPEGTQYHATAQADSTHITVTPAPPVSATPIAFRACTGGLSPNAHISDATFRYNIIKNVPNGIQIQNGSTVCGDISLGNQRSSFHDLILDHIDPMTYNLKIACCTWGIGFELGTGNPDPTKPLANVAINHVTALPYITSQGAGLLQLIQWTGNKSVVADVSPLTITNNIGPGLVGTLASQSCFTANNTAPNLSCIAATYCIQGNVASQTDGTPSVAMSTNLPYPASSPGCASTAANAAPAGYANIGFVNLNSGNGGDYRLCTGVGTPDPGCIGPSLYISNSTDGNAPGANVDLVNQYTAGVQ